MTVPADGHRSGGDWVLGLARLRRAEAGLVEQLATIRAAVANLEVLREEPTVAASTTAGLLTLAETTRVLRASRSRVF